MFKKIYIFGLLIFLLFLLAQNAFAQGNLDSNYYDKAYLEIDSMLYGRIPLSIKRAVFLAENAYLDGSLDYEKDFCEPIKQGADYL